MTSSECKCKDFKSVTIEELRGPYIEPNKIRVICSKCGREIPKRKEEMRK